MWGSKFDWEVREKVWCIVWEGWARDCDHKSWKCGQVRSSVGSETQQWGGRMKMDNPDTKLHITLNCPLPLVCNYQHCVNMGNSVIHSPAFAPVFTSFTCSWFWSWHQTWGWYMSNWNICLRSLSYPSESNNYYNASPLTVTFVHHLTQGQYLNQKHPVITEMLVADQYVSI